MANLMDTIYLLANRTQSLTFNPVEAGFDTEGLTWDDKAF